MSTGASRTAWSSAIYPLVRPFGDPLCHFTVDHMRALNQSQSRSCAQRRRRAASGARPAVLAVCSRGASMARGVGAQPCTCFDSHGRCTLGALRVGGMDGDGAGLGLSLQPQACDPESICRFGRQ